MTANKPRRFVPDKPSPPGATIQTMLDDLRMTQTELASRMGQTIAEIDQLIQGTHAVTVETAERLSEVLGMPADFWLRRQANYDQAVAAATGQ